MDIILYVSNTLHFLLDFAALSLSAVICVMLLTNNPLKNFAGSTAFFYALYAFLIGVAMQVIFYFRFDASSEIFLPIRLLLFSAAFLSLFFFGLCAFHVARRWIVLATSALCLFALLTYFFASFGDFPLAYLVFGIPASLVSVAAFFHLVRTQTTPGGKKIFFSIACAHTLFMISSFVYMFWSTRLMLPVSVFPAADYVEIGAKLLSMIAMFLLVYLFWDHGQILERNGHHSRSLLQFASIGLIFLVLASIIPYSLKSYAEIQLQEQVQREAVQLSRAIDSGIDRSVGIVSMFANSDQVENFLENPSKENYGIVQKALFQYSVLIQNRLFYILNTKGVCVASSHTAMINEPFFMRSYFIDAMKNGSGISVLNGRITEVPGIYISKRVMNPNGDPIGVVVYKLNSDHFLEQPSIRNFAVMDSDAIVRITNKRIYQDRRVEQIRPERITFSADEQVDRMVLCSNPEKNPETLRFAKASFQKYLPGWTLILGVWSIEPLRMYLLGCHMVLLLGLSVLFFWGGRRLFMKLQIQVEEHSNWREVLFQNNVSGVLILDDQLNVLSANATMLNLLGVTLEHLKKMKIPDFHMTNSEASKFRTVSETILNGGKFYDGEHRFKNISSDTPAICRISAYMLNSYVRENGFHVEKRLLIWDCYDQTEFLSTIETLTEREHLYRNILDSSPEHLFLLSPSGNFLYDNQPSVSKRLECGVPVRLSDYYPAETLEFYKTMVQNVSVMLRPLTFQHSIKAYADGDQYFNDTLYPVMKDGILIGIGGGSQDITSLKRPEEVLKKQDRRLRNLEKSHSLMIWESDRSNVLVYCSENIQNMTGYTQHELLGASILFLIPDSLRQRMILHAYRAIDKHQGVDLMPFAVRNISGKDIPVLISAYPQYDENNVFSGFIGICVKPPEKMEDQLISGLS